MNKLAEEIHPEDFQGTKTLPKFMENQSIGRMDRSIEVREALVSPCHKHRYSLSRIWDKSKPLVMYIGLNPSTADAIVDDPTIRRLRTFSKKFGYGGFYVCNLFSYRSAMPKDIYDNWQKIVDQHEKNMSTMRGISNDCQDIVFCWGAWVDSITNGYDRKVMAEFPQALCFGITAKGHPKHPLYLNNETELIEYKRK